MFSVGEIPVQVRQIVIHLYRYSKLRLGGYPLLGILLSGTE